MTSSAEISPCGLYRYELWRKWGDFDEFAMFIGVNPSTADATKDDPTIRKCVGFSKRWGMDALCMVNLFAFRATDPKIMKAHPNPVGERNQHFLLQNASRASIVIAAWGLNGAHKHQDLTVYQWLLQAGVKIKCLRKTKSGYPEHPLYVPYETQPIEWTP